VIERDDTLYVRGAELEALGHELHHVLGHPVVVGLLAQVEDRDARGHLVGIASENFLKFALSLRA
jgi:hypothetical protein